MANASMIVGVIEVVSHQVLTVYYVGLGVGMHLHLLLLPTLVWLARKLAPATRYALVAVSAAAMGLCFWIGATPPIYALDPTLVSAWLGLNAVLLFSYLAFGSHIYRTSADAFEADLKIERKRSVEQSQLLRTMFGRYLSVEVMNAMLDDPATLELGGQHRPVTIMMTDLRGFTALSETLPPSELLAMLNAYFEATLRSTGAAQPTGSRPADRASAGGDEQPQATPAGRGRAQGSPPRVRQGPRLGRGGRGLDPLHSGTATARCLHRSNLPLRARRVGQLWLRLQSGALGDDDLGVAGSDFERRDDGSPGEPVASLRPLTPERREADAAPW